MTCQIARAGPAQHGSFGRVVKPDGPGGFSLLFYRFEPDEREADGDLSEVYAASGKRRFPSNSSDWERSCLESTGAERYVLGRERRQIYNFQRI